MGGARASLIVVAVVVNSYCFHAFCVAAFLSKAPSNIKDSCVGGVNEVRGRVMAVQAKGEDETTRGCGDTKKQWLWCLRKREKEGVGLGVSRGAQRRERPASARTTGRARLAPVPLLLPPW